MAEQARRDGCKNVPALPDGLPLEAASQWLRELDSWSGERRILLCLDEFEKLEDLWPDDRRSLLQFMGLLRATIQHRRWIRLLVSGAAPFDELGSLWNDHFINVREVRLGHLDRATTVQLLTRPIAEFPPQAIPAQVAEEIFARTGGQPYLVQLFGSLLVARLNHQSRREATLDDLPHVQEEVLTQGQVYFRHTVRDAPEIARAVLVELASGRRLELQRQARRWLIHRSLITPDGQLAIPVLGAWIQEEAEAEEWGAPSHDSTSA